jgi:DNA repair exonuclease SbcCD ATPase subunit
VNQLARHRELDVRRLIKAGEQLGAAQAEAVRGRGADAFVEARKEEQRALQRLTTATRDLLAETGRPLDPNLDRVLATLRAAALTPEGRALLEQGRLTEELDPPGFEAFAGIAAPPPTRRPATRKSSPSASTPRSRPSSASRKQVAEARDRVREQRARLRRVEQQLGKARQDVARLRESLDEAQAEAEALEAERRQAENDLAAAERELEGLGRQSGRSDSGE